jgi:RNA polymerase sigma-70 factor (ECF subfamily)
MKEIAAGNQVALEALYDSTCRRVFGLALSILRDHEAAQEVAMDVYTGVWQQAHRFDSSRGSAETWLLTLAHHRAVDRLRSQRRQGAREVPLAPEVDLADPQPDPEATTTDADLARHVRRALRSIPEEQRRAIVAAYFGGLSHTEVAAALGQPLGTVKTRIRTGLASLRRALASTGKVQA